MFWLSFLIIYDGDRLKMKKTHLNITGAACEGLHTLKLLPYQSGYIED